MARRQCEKWPACFARAGATSARRILNTQREREESNKSVGMQWRRRWPTVPSAAVATPGCLFSPYCCGDFHGRTEKKTCYGTAGHARARGKFSRRRMDWVCRRVSGLVTRCCARKMKRNWWEVMCAVYFFQKVCYSAGYRQLPVYVEKGVYFIAIFIATARQRVISYFRRVVGSLVMCGCLISDLHDMWLLC